MRVLSAVLGVVVLSIIELTATGEAPKQVPLEMRTVFVDGQGAFTVVKDGAASKVDESTMAAWMRGVLRIDATTVIHVAATLDAPVDRVNRAVQLAVEATGTAGQVRLIREP
jgi:hypothetical protein